MFRGWLVALFSVVALVSCGTATPSIMPDEPTADALKADVVAAAEAFAEAVGNDVLEVEGTRWLNEKAPGVVAVLDTSKDGKVQLDEIRAAQAEMFTRQRVVQVLAAIAVAQIRRRG